MSSSSSASSSSSSSAPPSSAHAAPPVEAPRARSLAARVSGAVLLAFLAAGLVSTAAAVATGRLDLAPHAPPTRATFLDGASMRDMAAALADAPLARRAATLEREASWLAVGDLGPQVRQGCPGWLFLAEELAPQPDAARLQQARAEAVARIHAQLRRQHGIQLLVAMVPDKSRIEAARLCGLARSAQFGPRLQDWNRALRSAGVPVVDTSAALLGLLQQQGQDPFLRTDTHWTEAGARAAARAVADAVRGLGVDAAPHRDYDIRTSAPVRRAGDLVRLAGIDGLPLRWQPAPEEDTVSRFEVRAASSSSSSSSGSAGGGASAEDELFGDQDLPTVALIGTSFSRTSHFADFLAGALQAPVGSFAKDGGNFWGAAGDYFSGDAFLKTPPKLIIWEMPERVLGLPRRGESWVLR